VGSSHYYNPVRVHFGSGAIARLPSELADEKAVLITFDGARPLGLPDRIIDQCNGRIAEVIDCVQPNPDVLDLDGLYRDFWQRYPGCENIIALGGGSVLDTAKVLMVGTRSGSFDELLALLDKGAPFRPSRVKRLITIPTTAGTGSEVTPWATVWDRTINHKKYSLHLDQTWPYAAIVDPELTHSLPASVTLQSGLDALSHSLEAIWNLNANPISDMFAVAAAREMIEILPLLLGDLSDPGLRERASLAALKAGLAFSNTKTALAHSISYEMTIEHGLPHGIACSFVLPTVLQLAMGRDGARDEVLRSVFSCSLDRAPEFLASFIEALGVSTSFESYGVSLDQSQAMITRAMTGQRGKNFIGSLPL